MWADLHISIIIKLIIKEQKLLYKLHYKNDKQYFMTINATGFIVKKVKYDCDGRTINQLPLEISLV